jgi:thiamine-phosphate pyrophosphorylase
MKSKKDTFQNFKLYAVTDIRTESSETLDQIEGAYKGGADIVQLRSKTLRDSALFRLGQKAQRLANQYEKLLFINDRVDLAIAIHADGVHLGQDDLPISVVRRLAEKSGMKLYIGKSTHALDQAKAAIADGADYIGVGPVFETPTKPNYQPVGLEYVREVQSSFEIPFVAIGGIDESNVHQVLEAGASRIAVVRAIFGEKNTYEATKRIREKIENYGK